jgi:hypothetical protein
MEFHYVSVIKRAPDDNETLEHSPFQRPVYLFQALNELTNSLIVSQFIPYILSQSLLIDNCYYQSICLFHSGIIPFIFSEKKLIQIT